MLPNGRSADNLLTPSGGEWAAICKSNNRVVDIFTQPNSSSLEYIVITVIESHRQLNRQRVMKLFLN